MIYIQGSAATCMTTVGAVASEDGGCEDWFDGASFHYTPQKSSQLSGMRKCQKRPMMRQM